MLYKLMCAGVPRPIIHKSRESTCSQLPFIYFLDFGSRFFPLLLALLGPFDLTLGVCELFSVNLTST